MNQFENRRSSPLPALLLLGAFCQAVPGCSDPGSSSAPSGAARRGAGVPSTVPIDTALNRYIARVMVLNERHGLGEFDADSLGVLTGALRRESGVSESRISEYIDSHKGSLDDWESFLRSVQSTIRQTQGERRDTARAAGPTNPDRLGTSPPGPQSTSPH